MYTMASASVEYRRVFDIPSSPPPTPPLVLKNPWQGGRAGVGEEAQEDQKEGRWRRGGGGVGRTR